MALKKEKPDYTVFRITRDIQNALRLIAKEEERKMIQVLKLALLSYTDNKPYGDKVKEILS